MRSICILPGDGIGPEVVGCAARVLSAVTDELELREEPIGEKAFRSTGSYLPDETLDEMRASDSSLFGAVTSSQSAQYSSPVLRFRRELGLFANIRPIRSVVERDSAVVDLVIVRENTEGLYTMDEDEDAAGVTTRRRVSRAACTRIVEKAIEIARDRGYRKVCCVHKANVLRKSDGLFLEVFRDLAGKTERDISFSDQLVDSAAAKLVMTPQEFEVIVTLNLYGDILSDVAAGVVGGLGFAPSGNIGYEHSVFEPAHGSAPDIAGKGIANPTATILAAAMMLDHIGLGDEAAAVRRSIDEVYGSGMRTIDLGGTLGSEEFTDAVIKRLDSNPSPE